LEAETHHRPQQPENAHGPARLQLCCCAGSSCSIAGDVAVRLARIALELVREHSFAGRRGPLERMIPRPRFTVS